MCGRVIQSSGPLRYAILDGMDVRDSRVHNYPPRCEVGAEPGPIGYPAQSSTWRRIGSTRCGGSHSFWCEDRKGGRKPINAKCETVRTLPTFRDAYWRRRCIVPVNGFFEWKATKGSCGSSPFKYSALRGQCDRLDDQGSAFSGLLTPRSWPRWSRWAE